MKTSQGKLIDALLTTSPKKKRLTRKDQENYLLLISKGASPLVACQQLDISLVAISDALEKNEAFRNQLQRVQELMSQNVASMLYRTAIGGSVSAQTFYLKNFPSADSPISGEALEEFALENLSDEELIARFCQEAPLLLAELFEGDPETLSA